MRVKSRVFYKPKVTNDYENDFEKEKEYLTLTKEIVEFAASLRYFRRTTTAVKCDFSASKLILQI